VQYFELIGDAGLFGSLDHQIFDLGVGQHACVHHLDGGTFAQRDRHRAGLGCVASGGHVHGDAQVGVDAVGRGASAEQTHFFLHAKDKINLVGGLFELAQGLDEDGTGDAVVHALGDQPAASFNHRAGKASRIPHLDGRVVGAGGADVDVHFGDVQGFVTPSLKVFIDVDDANGVVGKPDATSDQGVRINAPDGSKAQESLFVDVGDHHPNLIHMGGEHHLEPAI